MSGKRARSEITPVRQQTQYNCMTTSLSMSLRALGVPEDESTVPQVNRVVGAMPMQGAAWEPLLAAANHYGMRATLTLPSTVRQLKGWTDSGTPVIIAWNPEDRDWSHASVVFDVTEDSEHGFLVHIADPNIPDPDETVRVLPKREFYSKWYEKSPQGFMIRRPACAIEREVTTDGRQTVASLSASFLPAKESQVNGKNFADRPAPDSKMASEVVKAYLSGGQRLAYSDRKLDNQTRSKINAALIKVGLDGNGRFRDPAEALVTAIDAAARFGLEPDEIVSSHALRRRPTIVLPVRMAFTNQEDIFSPHSISNSVLQLQITELRPDVFEAVAYMS